jgi:hypothetical protein
MGASSSFGVWRLTHKLAVSAPDWNATSQTISGQSGGFQDNRGGRQSSQIGGTDPEHFALGVLSVEP